MKRACSRGAMLCVYGAGSVLVTVPTALACPSENGISGGLIGAADSDCGHGCGPQDCGTSLPPAPSTLDSGGRGGAPFPVSVVDFTFLPNTPVIKPNTLVRWTNNGLLPHTATRLPMWDSGIMDPAAVFDFNFADPTSGFDYFYECVVHPGMEGHINVAHFGDANLDGTVNLSDFNILAANFGQTNRVWEEGDFDEDGTVNLSDFNLLAANFGKTIQPPSPGSTITIDFGGAFVPEPHFGAALALPVLLSGRRRRSAY